MTYHHGEVDNICVEVNYQASRGSAVVVVDGHALPAEQVRRSALLQELRSTDGLTEIQISKKLFALYQRFQHTLVHGMDEIAGVIQAASFLGDRDTNSSACQAAAHRLNAAFRRHCSDAIPPAVLLIKLSSPTSLLQVDRSGLRELFQPLLDLAVDDLEAILQRVHLSTTSDAPLRIREASIACRITNFTLDLSGCLTSNSPGTALGPYPHVICTFSPSLISPYIDALPTNRYSSLSLAHNNLTPRDLPAIIPLLTPPSSPLLSLDLSGNPGFSGAAIATLLPSTPALTRLLLSCAYTDTHSNADTLATALCNLLSLQHLSLSCTGVIPANVLISAVRDLPLQHLHLNAPLFDAPAATPLCLPELLPSLTSLTALHISDRVKSAFALAGDRHAAHAAPQSVEPSATPSTVSDTLELSSVVWALLAALPSMPDLRVLRMHAANSAMLRAPSVCSCYCVLLSQFHLTELQLPGCDRRRIASVLLHMPALRSLNVSDDPHDSCAAQAAVMQRRRAALLHALAAEEGAAASDASGLRRVPASAPGGAPGDPMLAITTLSRLEHLHCIRVHCDCSPMPQRVPSPPCPGPKAVPSASVPMPGACGHGSSGCDCACAAAPPCRSPSAHSRSPPGLLSAVLSNGSSSLAPASSASLERKCSHLSALRSLALCESSCGPLVETVCPAPPLRALPPFSHLDSFDSSASSSYGVTSMSGANGTPGTSGYCGILATEESGAFDDTDDCRRAPERAQAVLAAIAEPFLRPLLQLTRLELCHVRRMRSLLCGLARFAPELQELHLKSTCAACERMEHFDTVPETSRALLDALWPLQRLRRVALRSVSGGLVPAMLRCVSGVPALTRLELSVCMEEGEEWGDAGFVEGMRQAAADAFAELAALEELLVDHVDFSGGDRFLVELLDPIAVGRLAALQMLRVGFRRPPPQEWCRGLWQHMKGLPMQRGVHLVQKDS